MQVAASFRLTQLSFKGLQWEKKLVNMVWHVLSLIAIVMALYNVYLSWFEDNYSSNLLSLTLILVILSVAVKEYSEKQ